MSDASCLSCRYFRLKEAELGICMRYPPRVTGAPKKQDDYPDIASHTFWPALSHDNLCGEWQPEGSAK